MLFVHQLSFQIGDREKHDVSFYYSKWAGKVAVRVDGVEVASTRILLVGQSPVLSVAMGDKEKHDVRFDIKPGWSFFVKPKVLAYVDDRLVKTY